LTAAEEYMEEHKGAKVHVFDSRETGPGMALMIEKIRELKDKGMSFEEIRDAVIEYKKTTNAPWEHVLRPEKSRRIVRIPLSKNLDACHP
jgi:hypothetical protein